MLYVLIRCNIEERNFIYAIPALMVVAMVVWLGLLTDTQTVYSSEKNKVALTGA